MAINWKKIGMSRNEQEMQVSDRRKKPFIEMHIALKQPIEHFDSRALEIGPRKCTASAVPPIVLSMYLTNASNTSFIRVPTVQQSMFNDRIYLDTTISVSFSSLSVTLITVLL